MSARRTQPVRPKHVRNYIQFRAPPEWIAQVQEAASGLCLSLSAFVRLAVIEKVKRLERERRQE